MLKYRSLVIYSALSVISSSTLHCNNTVYVQPKLKSPVKCATVSYFYFWSIGPFYEWTDAGWVWNTWKNFFRENNYFFCWTLAVKWVVRAFFALFGQKDVCGGGYLVEYGDGLIFILICLYSNLLHSLCSLVIPHCFTWKIETKM